ncbi:peptidase M15C family protein [Rubrivivax gelatinosus IL144]|uniref:Peptidase M15C family protein n=1 Tax=Rubrivivax gelatinosus (strain NBRC 100245 / IL144) TaxID=983917 RepID=I0HSE4_RUBGI|nr:peptidase M15C family protein [Rubrivivax gelatinosus IL144]
MVIIFVVVYVVAVTLGLAFLCFPFMREPMQVFGQRMADRIRVPASGMFRQGGGRLQRSVGALRNAARDARVAMPSFSPWWLLSLLLLLLAPALAVVLRHWHAYDGFDHTYSRDKNARIAELLQGEQLVPPPRLPPDLFTTREVEQAHPLADSASRQWELLDADFRQRLLMAFKLMREQHGYEMVLLEGYRSPERQAQLASLGPAVTHAGAGQSYHQYGLAADCAFMRDGRIVISERDAWAARGYEHFGAVAEAVGLSWGGAWRTLVDLGHVELPRTGVLPRRSASA